MNWRKMTWTRPFTTAEHLLHDSVWDFQHPGGSFDVEFRADGYNHFVCNSFPAHSHWKYALCLGEPDVLCSPVLRFQAQLTVRCCAD